MKSLMLRTQGRLKTLLLYALTVQNVNDG